MMIIALNDFLCVFKYVLEMQMQLENCLLNALCNLVWSDAAIECVCGRRSLGIALNSLHSPLLSLLSLLTQRDDDLTDCGPAHFSH